MNPQDTKIIELENKIKELSSKIDQIKPIMDRTVIKNLESNFFRFGHVYHDGFDVIIPAPGFSIGNPVFTSGAFTSYVRAGTVNPAVNEIFISPGAPGEETNYVVFLTPNVYTQ